MIVPGTSDMGKSRSQAATIPPAHLKAESLAQRPRVSKKTPKG